MKKFPSLTSGPVGSQLVRMTVPMLMGTLSIMIFHLVDTFFLGRYSSEALTAVTFTFPVMMTLGSLALGLGVGVSAVVANAIGEGNQRQVQRLTTDSLFLSVLMVTACAGVGLLTMNPLFRVLGAEGEILHLVRQYMEVWYWSVGMVVIPMVGNGAIRATGDTRTPGLVMMVAAITNVVLDPILIFGWGPIPEMGVRGAALATAGARTMTLMASIYVLVFREKMVSRHGMTPAAVIRSWRRVLHVGIPAAGTRMVVPIAMGVITRLVATYGPAAVAAFGVGSRVGMFVFSVIMSLAAALGPFIGQNLGAGLLDRVRRATWLSCGFGFIYGILIWLMVASLARPIALLFNKDPEMVSAAVNYFRIVPIGAGFSAVLVLAGSVMNAMLKPGTAAGLTVLQIVILYLPLSFLGSRVLGLEGIFWASAVTNILAGIVAVVILRHRLKTLVPTTNET
ncbi:MAG: MATE family efflux transporter [Gemmatimonadales bacterium]|nr:MATE family efflux transporter [Gemmatimonadales bacterium]